MVTVSDWSSVSREQLINLGLRSLVNKYGGIEALVSKFYPGVQVQIGDLPASIEVLRISKIVQEIFPRNFDVITNYIPEFYSGMDKLDVYIPSLKLAFQYNGKLHYQNIKSTSDFTEIEKRDQEKIKELKKEGITLIQVPFWWDGKKESLGSTIHQLRPDLQLFVFANVAAIPGNKKS